MIGLTHPEHDMDKFIREVRQFLCMNDGESWVETTLPSGDIAFLNPSPLEHLTDGNQPAVSIEGIDPQVTPVLIFGPLLAQNKLQAPMQSVAFHLARCKVIRANEIIDYMEE